MSSTRLLPQEKDVHNLYFSKALHRQMVILVFTMCWRAVLRIHLIDIKPCGVIKCPVRLDGIPMDFPLSLAWRKNWESPRKI